MHDNRLLRVPEVADRLNVSPWQCYDLIRRHELPGVVRLGRAIRVDPTALEHFIENGGTDTEFEGAA